MFFMESDSDEENNIYVLRRDLRDKSDPLSLCEKEFRKQFRLSKDAFNYVLNAAQLSHGHRSTVIPPILKLAATLNLLGSGSYQVNVGSNVFIGMGQSTISKVFKETIKALETQLCPEWIQLKTENFNRTKKHFYNTYKIPGVVGCIDGTQIEIIKPTLDEHMMKGSHSINAMIICDELYRIIAVNSCYGGAAHDSFVWNMSNEKPFFEELHRNGNTSSRLLGDSGYGLAPWLLTPYRSADAGSPEEIYNKVHSAARRIVERAIGVLKGQWRCCSSDRVLRFAPEKASCITNVCAALHNICISHNVELNPAELVAPGDFISLDASGEDNAVASIAQRIRNSIRDSLLPR